VSSYWQTVFTGEVIILAVLLNSIQYGRRRAAKPADGDASTNTPSAAGTKTTTA